MVQQLYSRAKRLFDLKPALRACAGNLLLTRFGAAIDKHDVVLRLNQGPTVGYEEYVAAKTTFRMLNPLWLKRYSTNPTKLDSESSMFVNKETKPSRPTELPMVCTITDPLHGR